MRTEVDHHLLLSSAEHHGVCQSGQTRADFDRPSTGVVHDSVFESPAVEVPCPAGDGAVDEGSPEEHENHEWKNAATFGDSSSDDGTSHGTEL